MTRIHVVPAFLLLGVLSGVSACVGVDPAEPVAPAAFSPSATVLFGKIETARAYSAYGLTEAELSRVRPRDMPYFYRGFHLRKMDEDHNPVGEPIRIAADPSGHFMVALDPGEYWIWGIAYFEKDPDRVLDLSFDIPDEGAWVFDARSKGFEVKGGVWNNLGTLTLIESTTREEVSRGTLVTDRAWVYVLNGYDQTLKDLGLDGDSRIKVEIAEVFEVFNSGG
ncbi:hypothetical protein ACFL0I_05435 [Gemmatimonadota bacterium]